VKQTLNYKIGTLKTNTDSPITRAHTRLINFKISAHQALLELLMLNKEGGQNIDSLCDGPCIPCDTENDYFKLNPPKRNFTQKYQDFDEYTKLFVKLKECKDQSYQINNQINFASHHRFIKNLMKLKVLKHN
jgi:hypothetical protein